MNIKITNKTNLSEVDLFRCLANVVATNTNPTFFYLGGRNYSATKRKTDVSLLITVDKVIK